MRPVFVGNFEYDTRQYELERLFSKYGRVERVDMKSDPRIWTEIFSTPSYEDFVHLARPLHSTVSPAVSYAQASCFAFVYFEDERDAEDAIHGLDDVPFGYERRRLSVEWAKGERGRYGAGSRSMPNQRPTKTLFVINFDPLRTMARDIERHFEPYGRILNVRIRRNFAFVQFETQDDATRALECTHMSKMLDRVVSVEYALRDDDERDDIRGSYGRRGSSPYGQSLSPGYRRRPSPDYGRARSPGYDRYSGLAYRSPVYDRNRSSEYGRYRSRTPIRR